MKKEIKKDLAVFFDFDNTITNIDVIDDMLARFSANDRWKDLEKKWQKDEIGSRECLKGQVEGIRITKKALDGYLSTITIDPYFKKIVQLLKRRSIPVMIISDNFDYMLNKILHWNRISDMAIRCNKVDISGNRMKAGFPFTNRKCGTCANCKKEQVAAKNKTGAVTVYIGDGRSDVCAAKEADMVFAKDYLRKFLKSEQWPHVSIESLKDVYEYFYRSL